MSKKRLLPLFVLLLLLVCVIIVILVKKLLDKNDKNDKNDVSYQELSKKEFAKFVETSQMKNVFNKKDLFICGVIRDSSKTVLKNLESLTQIGSFFKSCRFILIENDSKDGTDQLLQNWAKDKQNVFLISKKMDHELEPLLPKLREGEIWSLSPHRFTKMALLRNMYMKKLEELVDPNVDTWVIVADLDLHSIPVKDTLESLNNQKTGNWDLICANGLTSRCVNEGSGSAKCNIKRKDNGKFGRTYDTLAIRLNQRELDEKFDPMNDPKKVTPFSRHHVDMVLKFNNKARAPVRVSSCFGGLAVYKAEKFKKLRYSVPSEDCEHVSINRHLSSVEVVPDFNVYYD